jgi:TonB family protein
MNREKVFGTEAAHDSSAAQAGEFNAGKVPPAKKPGREPAANAPSMDAMVSEFLEELDTVSAALTTAHKPAAEPRADFTHKSETTGSGRNIRKSSGPRTGLAFELDEDEDYCGDIDAELAQTLLELEERPKSNVIPLTIRESARPQPQSAAVPEIFVAPESLLLAPSVEAPAAPAAAPARPEIRFIPAASADEQPESGAGANWIARTRTLLKTLPLARRQCIPAANADERPESGAWVKNRIAHIQTLLKTLPLTWRKIAIGIAAMALIAVVLLAYQYYSAHRAKVGTTSQAPTSQGGSAAAGTVAKAPDTKESQPAAGVPAVPNGRQWVEQSATARVTSSQPRNNSSRAIPAVDQSGSVQAGMARRGENAGQPGAGRGELPAGATDVTVGSGASAAPPPAPGTAGSRGTEALPKITVETPPPAMPPATQSAAQQPNAAKSISEAMPASIAQIPAARRTAALVTAPPPSNLSNLELKTNSSPAKFDPSLLATPAVPLTKVNPEYPAVASRVQAKGKVELTIEVDERGNVVKATATSGPLVLRPAAEEALMKWRFKPATLRGANIKSEVNVYVEFKQ